MRETARNVCYVLAMPILFLGALLFAACVERDE